jgi:hypothetical protein
MESRDLNTRYTLVQGMMGPTTHQFVYDHEEETLYVEPEGHILLDAYEQQMLQPISALGLLVVPASFFRSRLMAAAEADEKEDLQVELDNWLDYLIESAIETRSQFMN